MDPLSSSPHSRAYTAPFRRFALLGSLVALALFLSLPSDVLAQGEEQGRRRFALTAAAYLLETPSPAALPAATLPAGTLVQELDATPDNAWRQVRPENSSIVGWIPARLLTDVALLITRTGAALHHTPALSAPFVRTLPPQTEVWVFNSVFLQDRLWRQVWTDGGIMGWLADDLLEPRRVIAAVAVALYPQPDHALAPITDLPPDTAAIVLEISPDSAWTRLQTSQGESGWAESLPLQPLVIAAAGEVRLAPDVQTGSANLRAGPGQNAAVVGMVAHRTPIAVVGRNMDGTWLSILTPDGSLAWISTPLVFLQDGLVSDLPVVARP